MPMIKSVVEFHNFIKRVQDAGFVSKTEYADATSGFGRFFEMEYEKEIASPFFWGKANQPYEAAPDPKLHDLFDARVYSLIQMKALGKKLDAVKNASSRANPIFVAISNFYHKHIDKILEFQELKNLVLSSSEIKVREKIAKEKAVPKVIVVSKEKLVAVLSQYIDEFIERAGQAAADYHKATLAQIKRAGGIDAIAPKPDRSRNGYPDHTAAVNKRTFFEYMAKVKKQEYVEEAKKKAKEDYDAWIHKMTTKIDKPIKSATMKGNPWVDSIIKITTTDGETHTWHTQMIINQSKFGKLFNQFPTRKSLREASDFFTYAQEK